MTFWVAGAVVVGGLATGAMSADASRSAANAQARSAANAQQISQDQFNTIQQQNAPFIQSGYGALSALDWGMGIGPQTSGGQPAGGMGTGTPTPNGYDPSSGYRLGAGGGISQGIPGGTTFGGPSGVGGPTGPQGMGPVGGSGLPTAGAPAGGQTGGLGYGSLTKSFDTSDWQKLSPAYNFQLRQGQQGVMNADAAGAGALSGAAQKDLIDYNQSAANTSFNSAFNQYQTQQGNIFSRLSGIAQLGQASANNTGQQGTALAGQAAQSATNIGTAQAGGIVGGANAWSGGINSAAPWLSQFAGGGSTPEINTTQIGNNANDVVNNTNWMDTSGYPVG
jgi:hypothetical protein